MRRTILATLAMVAIAFTTTGCTTADMEANMAKARDIANAIKRGAAMTAATVRVGLDAACANQPAVGLAYQSTRAILIQQVGPKTTQNIDRLDRAMRSYTNVCAAAANPSATDLTALLSAAIAAYAEVQAAQRVAGTV